MRPTWLLAKYTEDVRRREPRNVGVLLFTEDGVANRFVGQREDGTVDGRSAHVTGDRLRNYKAWVAYWEHHAQAHRQDPRRLLDQALSDVSYHLEYGGEELVGETAPDLLLAELYASLVVVNGRDDAPPSIREAAERIFSQLGISDRIQREPRVQRSHRGALDVLRFDYRFDNGRPHFLQSVPLLSGDKGWRAVQQAAYLFEKLDAVPELDKPDAVGLVRARDGVAEGPLALLRTYGPVVDVEAGDAVGRMAEILGV